MNKKKGKKLVRLTLFILLGYIAISCLYVMSGFPYRFSRRFPFGLDSDFQCNSLCQHSNNIIAFPGAAISAFTPIHFMWTEGTACTEGNFCMTTGGQYSGLKLGRSFTVFIIYEENYYL